MGTERPGTRGAHSLSHGNQLGLFSVFHLNLAYSSIEEVERAEVVRRCYRPLLRLARERRFSLAIEASGSTLETIRELDPGWIDELREALGEGLCEFVGSGYAQVIGPLAPFEVNRRNQQLGRESYRRLLGVEPELALVNEQAWSAGLVPVYREAGYRAVIMEWDNPSRGRDDWDAEWRYHPQVALSQDGASIPVLWNQSIAFQKFQRYAHGELTLDECIDYFVSHQGPEPRVFSAYGNDAEVFDYRPGRFATEPDLGNEDEWERIELLYEALAEHPGFELLSPGEALRRDGPASAGRELRLESSCEPIPVKKQGKYNITRWALTARDDLALNTGCYRAFEALRGAPAEDPRWRELCLLWSSDFRTHITAGRLEGARERLRRLERECGLEAEPEQAPAVRASGVRPLPAGFRVRVGARAIEIETGAARVTLNPRRGLALTRFARSGDEGPWLCGTLPHGFYDDIRWGADFYTGHLVFEGAGQPKVTDLGPAEFEIGEDDGGGRLVVGGVVQTPLGPVHKRWTLEADRPEVRLDYRIDWRERPAGRLRVGHLTLNPAAFDRARLAYRTVNGGPEPESYPLFGVEVDHAEAISFLVSASQVLGMTEGWIEVGDGRRGLRVRVDQATAAVLPMVTLREVAPSWFLRVAFSAQEMDDTSREPFGPPVGRDSRIRLEFTAI